MTPTGIMFNIDHNDLNAWHETERSMGDFAIDYVNALRLIVTEGFPDDPLFPVKLVRASAKQKHDAFLTAHLVNDHKRSKIIEKVVVSSNNGMILNK